jgi:hypothetical protein
MAWIFGDSFDLYAAGADMVAGYWDSGVGLPTLVAGRFTGSRAIQLASSNQSCVKSSNVNDAVHHVVCAIQQTTALSGTNLGVFFTFGDGATAQCSIVFRSDGAILLTSGGPTGTVLATYTGAITAINAWFAFEFEVVINNTTGSFTARKNGNPSNDFTLGSLNTRGGTTNNYANRLTMGMQVGIATNQVDDVLWRSDATSGAGLATWVGDIRCYARMPASDVQAQFSRSSLTANVNTAPSGGTSFGVNIASFIRFTTTLAGTIPSVVLQASAGATANVKAAIYDATGASGGPGAVLGTSNTLANPVLGANTLTFATPPHVVANTNYFLAVCQDAAVSWQVNNTGGSGFGTTYTVPFASFPIASPAVTYPNTIINVVGGLVNINTLNSSLVSEAQQDAGATYVFDSTVGDADFYGIASIPVTPVSTIAVTTRGFAEKSDAGARSGAVQLKSGGTTVASPAVSLNTTWGWLWRTDVTDPATGAAWTPTAVNNAQVGPTVTA